MPNLIPISTLFLGAALAPAWIIIPFAAVTLLVLAGHVLALGGADMPASRRRIRLANGLVMMFATPLTAYAFCIAAPEEPRVFTIVWTLVAGLLFLVVMLAGLDLLNTWRLLASERRRLRAELKAAREEAMAAHSRVSGTPKAS